jgi:hypothetical protein
VVLHRLVDGEDAYVDRIMRTVVAKVAHQIPGRQPLQLAIGERVDVGQIPDRGSAAVCVALRSGRLPTQREQTMPRSSQPGELAAFVGFGLGESGGRIRTDQMAFLASKARVHSPAAHAARTS